MESIYAYHITDISNIKSILVNGLIPNIGENSRQAHEHYFLTYFTTINNIESWIKRFNLEKNRIVTLKFMCTNYGQRYDSAGDYFTSDSIPPDKILVVEKGEQTLNEFYRHNKEKIELELNKSILNDIKVLIQRLDQIEFASLIPETDWDYNETEPNIVKTIDLLKKVKCVNKKNEYKDIIDIIKGKTLKKLLESDLKITEDSELYKLLNSLFIDSLSDSPRIDIMSFNYAIQILSINLFYRQLDRYKRTRKKYGNDNTIWKFDELPLEHIQNMLNNDYLKGLLNETTMLYEEQQNNKKYK